MKEWFRIVGYHGSLFTLEDLKLCLSDADVATKNRHGETVSDVLLRTKYNMDDISNGQYKYWMQWSKKQQQHTKEEEEEGTKKQHVKELQKESAALSQTKQKQQQQRRRRKPKLNVEDKDVYDDDEYDYDDEFDEI